MKNSNNKILTIAVVLLLIANIALVAFMIRGKNKGNPKRAGGKGNPAEMMYTELNMTEEQKTAHKLLKEEHFKNSKPLFDSLRAAKIAFFTLLKDSTVNDSVLDQYTQRICEKQSTVDKLTFAHFKRMRNIFTPEQQPKFDEFVLKMQRGRKEGADKKNK
ncbi:MAG: Spy/CpxP family protein refolding chaperone [Ferruginibacter sp.]|nr:Spy/CpxP family protein refolding chaperone [Chitinophagaceae bacterium]